MSTLQINKKTRGRGYVKLGLRDCFATGQKCFTHAHTDSHTQAHNRVCKCSIRFLIKLLIEQKNWNWRERICFWICCNTNNKNYIPYALSNCIFMQWNEIDYKEDGLGGNPIT